MIRLIMIAPGSPATIVDYPESEIGARGVYEQVVYDVLDIFFDGDEGMIEGVMEKIEIDDENHFAYVDEDNLILRIQYEEQEGGIR